MRRALHHACSEASSAPCGKKREDISGVSEQDASGRNVLPPGMK